MASFTSAHPEFSEALKQKGWVAAQDWGELPKGSWIIVFDTSSWMMVGTDQTPRVFDVPVPEPSLAAWTVNLIEYLCAIDDKLRS
jgi:hypothetical protein